MVEFAHHLTFWNFYFIQHITPLLKVIVVRQKYTAYDWSSMTYPSYLLTDQYFSDKGRRLSDFTLGNFIAKGSYGAVFNAKLKTNFETDSDFNCSKEFDQKCNLGTFQNLL